MNMEKKSTIIKVLITVLVVATLVATMTFALTGCSKNEPMQTDPTTQTEPSGTESTDPKPTDPQVKTYTVTFKDHDGTVLKTETVEEGKAATAPADPTREGYTFEGWDKTFDNVTADMEVTATYKAVETKPTDPQVTTYTVTFKDYDGKVLKTQKVESGKSATAPANPTRTHYTFTGWDKAFNKITADLVVTATYKINEYTVTFKDYDGTVLKTQKVESGKAATAPADPTRTHYTFTGWDKTFNNITSDLVVTATYKINQYTVTFKDYDGTVLKTQKVESGKAATAPADPTRTHYTFTGWDKAFDNVTSDLVVTATYKINEYTVTFKDYDGTVLKTQKVESGKAATAPANPTRTHYTFTGWDKSFNKITADLVVTATYKINEYTVTFKDYNGAVLKTEKVESGKAATAPAEPTREHYKFAGWDKSFSNVTSDLVVTATYSTTKLIISAESVTVNKGTNEVTMKIRVTNNPGIMGAVLKVSVNDDVFAFASASKTGYPGLTLTAPGSGTTSSPYTFMLDSLDLSADDKKDGTLFTITFKIKDTSATGKYDVKLSCNKGGIFDENYNDLDVTFVNGTITIQ